VGGLAGGVARVPSAAFLPFPDVPDEASVRAVELGGLENRQCPSLPISSGPSWVQANPHCSGAIDKGQGPPSKAVIVANRRAVTF
jgi:hypothetical protein